MHSEIFQDLFFRSSSWITSNETQTSASLQENNISIDIKPPSRGSHAEHFLVNFCFDFGLDKSQWPITVDASHWISKQLDTEPSHSFLWTLNIVLSPGPFWCRLWLNPRNATVVARVVDMAVWRLLNRWEPHLLLPLHFLLKCLFRALCEESASLTLSFCGLAFLWTPFKLGVLLLTLQNITLISWN